MESISHSRIFHESEPEPVLSQNGNTFSQLEMGFDVEFRSLVDKKDEQGDECDFLHDELGDDERGDQRFSSCVSTVFFRFYFLGLVSFFTEGLISVLEFRV